MRAVLLAPPGGDSMKRLGGATVALMWRRIFLLVLASGVIGVGSSACERRSRTTESEVITDVGKFVARLRLPVPVQAVTYQVTRRGDGFLGPSDYSLLAVFEVRAEDVAQLIEGLTVGVQEFTLKREEWLEGALGDQSAEVDASRIKVRGQVYGAGPLVRMPLQGGVLVRVGETNRFIVSTATR